MAHVHPMSAYSVCAGMGNVHMPSAVKRWWSLITLPAVTLPSYTAETHDASESAMLIDRRRSAVGVCVCVTHIKAPHRDVGVARVPAHAPTHGEHVSTERLCALCASVPVTVPVPVCRLCVLSDFVRFARIPMGVLSG